MHLQTHFTNMTARNFTKSSENKYCRPQDWLILIFIEVMLCDPLIQELRVHHVTAELKINLSYKAHLICCTATAILSVLTTVQYVFYVYR